MVKVGIIGGAGYTAGELLRILINHPEVEITFAQSSSNSGNLISDIHFDLLGDTDLRFISDIPFHGPISEVRVVRVDGKFIVNPSMKDAGEADIDMIIAATLDNILMVEGEMNEVSEAEMVEAIASARG